MADDTRPSVLVLYNFVGDDEYERLKDVDPKSLEFEPEYDINVPTVIEEYEAVAKALRREGYRATAYNIREDLSRLQRRLKRNPPDVIFNLVEFFDDDPELEPDMVGLYELYRIAYTGSTAFTLTLCQDKPLTKKLLLDGGVRTPRFVLLEEPRVPKRFRLRFPVIVKPALEDASSGVEKESVCHDTEQLAARLEYVHKEFPDPILVEEFIEGTELHVAVLGDEDPEVLPPIQWDFSELPDDHPSIISFAAKWNPLSEIYHRVHSVCPPTLPAGTLKKVEKAVLKAFEATWCRDYARIDVRVDHENRVWVLEVNPNPDLTEGVSLMESAEEAGYSFGETLAQIVEFALERKEEMAYEQERRRIEREKQKPASPEALTATLDGYPVGEGMQGATGADGPAEDLGGAEAKGEAGLMRRQDEKDDGQDLTPHTQNGPPE
jgi:D-alanine-D-alanine ligase